MNSLDSVSLRSSLESIGPMSESEMDFMQSFHLLSVASIGNYASRKSSDLTEEDLTQTEKDLAERIFAMRSLLEGHVRQEMNSKVLEVSFPTNEEQAANLIKSRDDFVSNGTLFLKRVEHIMDSVQQDIQKIDACAAEKFEIIKSEVLKKGTSILENRVASIFYPSFSHFYSTTFDAFPDFHEQFHGSSLGDELYLMHSDIESFLEQKREDLSEEQIQTLDTASSHFLLGSEIDRLQTKSPEEAREFFKGLAEDVIPNLKIGEQIIIPGSSKRHAILYQITRVDEENYIFMIINTGDDERKLYTRKSIWTKIWENISGTSPRYAHKGYQVKIDVFTPEFLQKIAYSEVKDIPAPDLIGWFDQIFIKEGNGVEVWGRLHHPQERGNCAPKSVASCFKGICIERHGEVEGNALYYSVKSHRAQKKMGVIQKLEGAADEKTLKRLYSDLQYKKSAVYDHYAIPKIIKRTPPDDALLQERLADMYYKANTMIARWMQKAGAYSSANA